MATAEEMHATRGRARLLWEAMKGEVLTSGWREPAVKEALDLCLSCKGCKGECPVHVDMATYKAEFLSHYYERRLRPLKAYAFGYIDRWSRLAMQAPGLANSLANTALSKRLLGIAPQRTMPRFASRSFTRDSRARAAACASSCGLTPSTTTTIRKSRTPRSRCWRLPAARYTCRRRPCAAGG